MRNYFLFVKTLDESSDAGSYTVSAAIEKSGPTKKATTKTTKIYFPIKKNRVITYLLYTNIIQKNRFTTLKM